MLNDPACVAAIAMHSVMGEADVNLDRVERWMHKSDLSFAGAMAIAEYAAAAIGSRFEALC